MDLLRYFEQQQVKNIRRPRLQAGDLLRVETKVEEGGKTRLQTFEGTMIGIRGSGPSTTFVVRRETGGFGVERIFPLYSPLIANIHVVKRQKVRRAKLNYLRQAGRRRFKEDVKAMYRHEREIEEAAERERREAEAREKERLVKEAEDESKKDQERQAKESSAEPGPSTKIAEGTEEAKTA